MLKQVQELNPEKSDPQPQQRLIWRGGGGTLPEAVLKAVKACASLNTSAKLGLMRGYGEIDT